MSEPGSSQVAEDAGRAGAQDQLLRRERRADGRGDGVGVDVEQRAGAIRRQRAHHRHQAVVEQLAQHRGVDRLDVADEAVSRPARRCPRPAPARARWARTRPASTPLMPTASMSRSRHMPSIRVLISPFSTMAVTSIALLVGDAPALRPCASGTPSARRHLGELRAAAVHQHDAHAEVVQDRDLLDQRARRAAPRRTPRRRPSRRRSCPCTCGCRARRCAARGWRGSGRCGA